MEQTEILVLRKTPFRETSLVVAGIGPDDGLFDFVMKGATQSGKNKFPVIDLFRVVAIEFKPVREGMPTVYSAEQVSSFDRISSEPDGYLLACEMAKFALENSAQNLPCPELFGAMTHILSVLCGYTDIILSPQQCRLLFRLAYLNENGLLPDQLSNDPKKDQLQHRLMAILLEAAQGDMPLPNLDNSYWNQLTDWTRQLCEYHGLK